MCTALSHSFRHHYFGRTLDFHSAFGECITVTPRNYPFRFHYVPEVTRHYALIGMATVVNDYPLYFEAVNELGLGVAGLLFPDNAVYRQPEEGKINLAPYEVIPWLLGQCATAQVAADILRQVNICATPFDSSTPLSPLHWLIADDRQAFTAEPMQNGLRIYQNPFGVLTNNPPFPFHSHNMEHYAHLSNHPVQGSKPLYSNGLAAYGLPGDYSSGSRFVRCAFLKQHCTPGDNDAEDVCRVFQILSAVAPIKGCIKLSDGKEMYTQYSCCCDTEQDIYYYTTHSNPGITAVDLRRCDLDNDRLQQFSFQRHTDILFQ